MIGAVLKKVFPGLIAVGKGKLGVTWIKDFTVRPGSISGIRSVEPVAEGLYFRASPRLANFLYSNSRLSRGYDSAICGADQFKQGPWFYVSEKLVQRATLGPALNLSEFRNILSVLPHGEQTLLFEEWAQLARLRDWVQSLRLRKYGYDRISFWSPELAEDAMKGAAAGPVPDAVRYLVPVGP